MILVFIFLGLLIITSILFLIFILSTIKIKIENLQIGKYTNNKYKAFLQLYFLNKIKIFSIRINNERIRKVYLGKQLEKVDFNKIKENVPINKESFSIIKKLKLELEKLNLKIDIGTEDAVLTSYAVATIASLLGIILPHLVKNRDYKEIKYIVEPMYNIAQFNMYLDSIISLKVVHIIYVIYCLAKKGKEKKHERTSNRRAYAYSHEFN